ncbi:MAG: ABC transporter permease subunit, partial [Gammaproteobacteria bacterium]|nr:ABC transporter permease subunit [Gammaproteobacteria bacterium]
MTATTASVSSDGRNVVTRIWNDKETRSVIIQIIAFAVILGFFVFIIRNAVLNLEALGKGFSFGFLTQPASYDINQHLIDYSSRSSHFRAGVVGLINTLLIAIAGIVLSTVLGFILGVLRLSKNWLTNKLAHVYIEYVRNVPVLLHILLIHGVIIHSLPVPKKALSVGEGMFLTNRGLFAPKPEF